MTAPTTHDLLKRICSQPTAPFREGWVAAELCRVLDEASIPYCEDRAGNLIAGVASFDELQKGFRIALMAHMDHPGFHFGPKQRGGTYQCSWYGGAPWRTMQNAPVRLFDPNDRARSASGHIVKIRSPHQTHDDGLKFTVAFDEDVSMFSQSSFGTFDFPGFELSDDLVRTRAADDLAGCVVALGALLDQERARAKKKASSRREGRRLVGIFTRAEEVGFIGCLHLLRKKLLPDDLWVVSLEASKALPEAEAGRGPVLRIGDSRCLFDPELSALLWTVAKDLEASTQRSINPFRYQRRLMSGGMCEGTPLTIYGLQVAAIAVPLLNYHNIGADGPAPEMIALADVDAARRLCVAFGERFSERPDWRAQTKREILETFAKFEPLLKTKHRFDEGVEIK